MLDTIIATGISREAALFVLKDMAKKISRTGGQVIAQYESSFVYMDAAGAEKLIYYRESDQNIMQRES